MCTTAQRKPETTRRAYTLLTVTGRETNVNIVDALRRCVISYIFIDKTGAGEGIRTLDPNLGKGTEVKEKQRLSRAKASKTGTQK